ncbi:MAG: hypothetical protein Alpg2KO_25370 [Alphaproteobacteria bacterium]
MTSTAPQPHIKAFQDWAAWWDALTPDTVDQLDDLATADLIFADPFNRVEGTDRLKAILAHMYEAMIEPRFEVIDIAPSLTREGIALMHWRFHGRIKSPSVALDFKGCSEITLSEQGDRVASHVDYWDSGMQFYGQMPVLGSVIRAIARRMEQ